MSEKIIKEEEAKDLMNKAGISEDVSDGFLQKQKEPEEEVLEEEAKEWSSEYQNKIEKEMPEDLYEEEHMEDEPEMDMGDEEMDMEEPEMNMGDDKAGGGEVDAIELGRSVLDALKEVPGVEVKGGFGSDEEEPPEDDLDMEEPEMGGGPEVEPEDDVGDEVIEEIANEVMNELGFSEE